MHDERNTGRPRGAPGSARQTLTALATDVTARVRDSMRQVVEPLRAHRRAQRLRSLSAHAAGRKQLSGLLDEIAQRGGFSGVVLSDEVGFLLAESRGARDAEGLAGLSSLVFTLADRTRQAGRPPPTAVVVRDAADQRTLHRMFSIDGERYLLTAVSAQELSVDALDPTLTALERCLDRADGDRADP